MSSLKEIIRQFEILSSDWVRFRMYFYPQMAHSSDVQEFHEIKQRLTTGTKVFLKTIEFDIEIAQSFTDILGKINRPEDALNVSTASLERIEDEWNSVYLLIQETLGLLEYRQEVKEQKLNPMYWLKSFFIKEKRFDTPDKDIYRVKPRKNNSFFKVVQFIAMLVILAILLLFIFEMGGLDYVLSLF